MYWPWPCVQRDGVRAELLLERSAAARWPASVEVLYYLPGVNLECSTFGLHVQVAQTNVLIVDFVAFIPQISFCHTRVTLG